MNIKFIHLSVHSEYSLVDGLIRIQALVKKACEYNYPAVALTDQSNLFAAVKFYQAAMKAGIKPILGCHLYVVNDKAVDNPYSVIALCQNNQGYRNLTELVSRSFLEGQYQGRAQVQQAWLFEKNEGIIILSGARQGDIGKALLAKEEQKADILIANWNRYFPHRYYLELQLVGHSEEQEYNQAVIQLASRHTIPLVATNAVCFLEQDDFEAHEARVCINKGFTLNDPKRPHLYTSQQFFRNAEQMVSLFSKLSSALENTVEIAKRCNLTLNLGTYHLPLFPIPNHTTLENYFSCLANEGLEQRLSILFSNKELTAEQKQIYHARLQQELDVIISMGFAGYFLIVADFIQWAKNQGIPVGPGRGSGAGSLVAYSLKITDLDPLSYDLLFERFLNPERISMPDFDVDFCMEGRDRVIEYVASKYGRKNVSQIITYGTMAAKAVVRDVGRVLNHPYGFVDKIAKLIPFELGITLDKALATEHLLLERYNQEPEVTELIDLAKKLEGITRNAGKHAGGVVIAPSPLTDFCPLYCEENEPHIVTQFDKDDIEKIGLVKFDFLGLRTLTIINWAVQSINKKQSQVLDISLIPLNDSKTYELLANCKTTAVFQLESRGMKDLIKRLQPDCFEDIIALVALFRPGPLQSGMVDDFIDRKHGRAIVEYPHPSLEPILRSTYGVILYQEQVMQIAQLLAGYTLGGADLLRRAMGKKKAEEMAKQRAIFVEGAIKREISKDKATTIFNLMEKFADYGFNKSHSAAYALVAYQTAWLKAHYPAEFMAAVLSSDMDNTDKVVVFYNECKQLSLIIRPPHINEGEYVFIVNDDHQIVYGFGAIKGVGESAALHIVEIRKSGGPFSDLFEFCRRVDIKKVNKRALEALISSGALDIFGKPRAVLMASLPLAMRYAEQHSKTQSTGQLDLFSMMEVEESMAPAYIEGVMWNENQQLEGEKETLGLYLSGHPINAYVQELQQVVTTSLSNLQLAHQRNVIIAGFVTAERIIQTKKGDRMAFITVDDNHGQIDVVIFSDMLNDNRTLIAKGQLVIVEGEVTIDDYSGGYRMSCNKLMNLSQLREVYAKQIVIALIEDTEIEHFTSQLAPILSSFKPGNCAICVNYHHALARTKLVLGNEWRVIPTEELLEQLRQVCGSKNVTIEY